MVIGGGQGQKIRMIDEIEHNGKRAEMLGENEGKLCSGDRATKV